MLFWLIYTNKKKKKKTQKFVYVMHGLVTVGLIMAPVVVPNCFQVNISNKVWVVYLFIFACSKCRMSKIIKLDCDYGKNVEIRCVT